MMTDKRVGVFICYCGGNISDYVDVERVKDAVENAPGVKVARTHMFTCSDAAQQEMIEDIRNNQLDSLVVASCSPKLHLYTFRAMAERAGLNPYQYTQVNLREQCSWAHREDRERATEKAIGLTRAGVARILLAEPMSIMRIETTPSVLVIGAGVAGLRAALALSELGLSVYLIEKETEVGGWIKNWDKMFLHEQRGSEVIENLAEQVARRENITLFTNAELVQKSGSVGDFSVKVQIERKETISLEVGAILVATGFIPYVPHEGEFGYGQEGVINLPDFKEMVSNDDGALIHNGRNVKDIVYIYCVGSRQTAANKESNTYCSRYCCNASVHEALLVYEKDPSIRQFHLFRDMRTYGKHEILYEEACKKRSVFIRYKDDDPPSVERMNGRLRVAVNDRLLGGERLEINADLVVLATAMVPRENEKLVDVLKIPVGIDGFFNEIHPKLRPVETVVDGVFIVGTAQGPKTMAESVASALAGVSKCAALLKKGYVDLEPFIARIDAQRCVWCDKCVEACPYQAIEKVSMAGRDVARVNKSLCKGGGACVPVCPEDAIDLEGYTDMQVKAMIDALVTEEVRDGQTARA